MYADTGLMYPYFQNYPQELQQFDEFYCSQAQKPNASWDIASGISISDNNLWGGDLFQAPQVVIEEPVMGIDPMTAAISMMSCGEDIMSSQSLAVSEIESSIESGQILSDVYYECRKDLLAKEGNEIQPPLSEVLKTDATMIPEDDLLVEDPFHKSIATSCCLNSTNVFDEAPLKPSFLDLPIMDFGEVYGMRRAFSEGDIKTLGHGNISFVQSQMEQPPMFASTSNFPSEERREKLSRYRSKKSRRNFDRKIKYACRKALADSQPRIRGRFAKTEETESSK